MSIPDSGNYAALGYAKKSGIPFEFGMIRNHYVGRTFIKPSQEMREYGVKIKLNPIKEVLKGKKVSDSLRAVVSPATPDIYSKALDEGIIKIFMDAGYCVTNPTCGACLGMSNGVLAEGETCASTTNRNFNGRMGKGGMVHLMSPATAAQTSITGVITNSPLYTEGV